MNDATNTKEALRKLFVGSGGKGRSVRLDNGWRIGMWENDRDDDRPWVLVLTLPNGREARWPLERQQVCTKGRSPWRRDNVWRLTQASVLVVSAALEGLFQDPRAKQ